MSEDDELTRVVRAFFPSLTDVRGALGSTPEGATFLSTAASTLIVAPSGGGPPCHATMRAALRHGAAGCLFLCRDGTGALAALWVRPEAPFEPLQLALSNVYETLFRTHGDDIATARAVELANVLRCRITRRFEPFDVARYVHACVWDALEAAGAQAAPKDVAAKISDAVLGENLPDMRQLRSQCAATLELRDDQLHDVQGLTEELVYWQYMGQRLADAKSQLEQRLWLSSQEVLDRRGRDRHVENILAQSQVRAGEIRDCLQRLMETNVATMTSCEDVDRYIKDVLRGISKMAPPHNVHQLLPSTRLLQLAECVVRDVCHRVCQLAGRKATGDRALNGLSALCRTANEARNAYQSFLDQLSGIEDAREIITNTQKFIDSIARRLRDVEDLLNNHERLKTKLRSIFGEDHQTLVAMNNAKAGVDKQLPLVWNVAESGAQAHQQMIEEYEKALGKIDGTLVTLIRHRFDGASVTEMYNIHKTFQGVKRDAVQAVLSTKQGELLAAIAVAMEAVQRRFTDDVAAQRYIRVLVATGVSAAAARVLWLRSLEDSLQTQLEKRDAILGFGWKQLLADRTWTPTEQFATVIGVTLPQLTQFIRDSGCRDVKVATACIALSALELIYPDAQTSWSRDTACQAAERLVRSHKDLRHAARAMLEARNVGAARGDSNRDAQRLLQKVTSAVEETKGLWIQQVRQCMASVPHDGKSRSLTPHVFCVRGGHLRVNFPPLLEQLIADARMLDLALTDRDRNDRYTTELRFIENNENKAPLAVTLSRLLRAFYERLRLPEASTLLELFAADYENIIRHLQEKVKWAEEALVVKYTRSLSTSVNAFVMSIDTATSMLGAIEERLAQLEGQHSEAATIIDLVQSIRSQLVQLSLHCPNARPYAEQLQRKVWNILGTHVSKLTAEWTKEYDLMCNDASFAEPQCAPTPRFGLSPLAVKLQYRRGVIVCSTEPHVWRNHWYAAFNRVTAWLLDLPELVPDATGVQDTQRITRMHQLVERAITDGHPQRAIAAIESTIRAAVACQQRWNDSQTFYSLDVDTSASILGDDLERWLATLKQIQQDATEHMNAAEPRIHVGGLVIDTLEAQERLSSKFKQAQQALLHRFLTQVGKHLPAVYQQLREARTEVEGRNVSHDVQQAILYLTQRARIAEVVAHQKERLPLYRACEDILRQYQVLRADSNWVSVERIERELETLEQAVERTAASLKSMWPKVLERVKDMKALIASQTQAIDEAYRSVDYDNGNMPANTALQQLEALRARAAETASVLQQVRAAQGAMGEEPIVMPKLEAITADLTGLVEAWESARAVYNELDVLHRTALRDITVRDLHTKLQMHQKTVVGFSASLRTYGAVKVLTEHIAQLVAQYRLFQELRSDVIHDRHWQQLKTKLRASWNTAELRVGDIWDSKPLAHTKEYREVLDAAHGEHRLTVQVDAIANHWTTFPLSSTPYQGNRVLLIRGWDALFERIADDLNTLRAMRHSPYFQHPISSSIEDWDRRLDKVRQVLEILLEVQRRWVYLDGIFEGSNELRSQLVSESVQFSKTSKDFVSFMPRREVSALEIVAGDEAGRVKDVVVFLERLDKELTSVQRALGDFLEGQRGRFPRFLFVGDDDLLEVIGRGKDPLLVAKHLKKMFAGIATVHVEGSLIVAVASAEGEVLNLRPPFDTANSAVHDWLAKLEHSVVVTLKEIIVEAAKSATYPSDPSLEVAAEALLRWIDMYPGQVVSLVQQIHWTRTVDAALAGGKGKDVISQTERLLAVLSHALLNPKMAPTLRSKAEQLVTAGAYQRDITRHVVAQGGGAKSFGWERVMRPILASAGDVTCHMADASLPYSYEYLGLQERLVQTTLTDRCYLTLVEALHARLGGSPSGPAGTGKTETVKALGMQLGRFVLVFNCDDTFDFGSMGRILSGLCRVGAWGCFDEFNRLEEAILSAVSQLIYSIQQGLRSGSMEATIGDAKVPVHRNVGVFITMNPGYAGRSNLPDNLKQLFRPVAMSAPDRENIAEVMLFAQGFQMAESIARKVVPLFSLCSDQLSKQAHYDFGLRALKAVLISAGGLKRAAVSKGEQLSSSDEYQLMMQALVETVLPKLTAADVALFQTLVKDVFVGVNVRTVPTDELIGAIQRQARLYNYVVTPSWQEKILQLYRISHVNHGIMLVGSSGSGKTAAWSTLLRALAELEDLDCYAYVIDPKALSKAEVYGTLDPTTREWKDGVFTATLRRLIDKGDSARRCWIIFDGEVDPEWVENLNSLLDDNKLLTLPNGERLALPPYVRVVFEVDSLQYATPATVSRCGMVWFADDTISASDVLERLIQECRAKPMNRVSDPPALFSEKGSLAKQKKERAADDGLRVLSDHDEAIRALQVQMIDSTMEDFSNKGVVYRVLTHVEDQMTNTGIMAYSRLQCLFSFMVLFMQGARDLVDKTHPDMKLYAARRLRLALLWGFGSSQSNKQRESLSSVIAADIPNGVLSDYDVGTDGSWTPWRQYVSKVTLPPHKVGTNDTVIPTVDTARHEACVSTWLRCGRPVLLCGPPGSGKTMSLSAVLRSSPDLDAAFLNFSSATTPEAVVKTLEQYCTVTNTLHGLHMSPTSSKLLIVFCDEVNLPAPDRYGTQRVAQFLRSLTERGGYYRSKDGAWVGVSGVQFVGACNPPTDPGRTPLAPRLLRWAPVLFVDCPSAESLRAVYATYATALLAKGAADVRASAEPLAEAMIDVYQKSTEAFTTEKQRHYVYSPRELSRWSRAVYEGMKDGGEATMGVDDVVRLAVHEGLRLFADRLATAEEVKWTEDLVEKCFLTRFPSVKPSVLERPILYSTLLTRSYTSCSREQLRTHIREKLRTFADEELDVQLVVFDSVIDHITRIDRVLRQPLGHMLLVGASGVGKTVLSRFVAWYNNLSVFQVKVHRGYTLDDFENDLRGVLRRSGCKGEDICFIFDEGNILDSNFLEYMNALLASGEVPGLFDGEEWPKLIQEIREGVRSAHTTGGFVDESSESELYRWFVSRVQRHLHVVFTMNPYSADFQNRTATSPALFNRCTIDWFGDWSDETIHQVVGELTAKLDVMEGSRHTTLEAAHAAVSQAMAQIHRLTTTVCDKNRARNANRGTYVTPRHLLDYVAQFHTLFREKRGASEELHRHLSSGLHKLAATTSIVDRQRVALQAKEVTLFEAEKKSQQMLNKIVEESEKERMAQASASSLSVTLQEESQTLEAKRQAVEKELAQAEPALRKAEAALSTIKPESLRELRAYSTPPAMVKKVLEAVVTILGERRAYDWDIIKGYIRRDDFIPQVRDFKPSNILPEAREKVKKSFLSDEQFTVDHAQRASKAAGPLLEWAVAQIRYGDIYSSVEPMRATIDTLSAEYERKQKDLDRARVQVAESTAAISELKAQYEVTMQEQSRIKMEVEAVRQRCDRATSIVTNLEAERQRWTEQSQSFKEQSAAVVGDCLISAAFLAYMGYFDELTRRRILFPEWMDIVGTAGITFRQDISLIEYLSSTDERQRWTAHRLPQDDICMENAIIITRCKRYPLIIDPTGEAVEYLLRSMQHRKITKTSFIEKGFMKQVELAVRFGYPILVQDVEYVDPVMNPLLNREVQRINGRHVVRLGAQDVDMDPAFNLILSTRDSTFPFAPDICGRTSMVNYTVTLASLQSQCLHRVMHHERPDIDEKRAELVKLQGEYGLRLRQLEQDLLTTISNSEGNLLEDNALVQTLQKLKAESRDVEDKMKQSSSSYLEIQHVEEKYGPVATAASRLYFALEALPELNPMYRFSLRRFFEILGDVLVAPSPPSGEADRLAVILRGAFVTTHRRVARSLVSGDRTALGLRLAQLRCTVGDDVGRQIPDDLWRMLTTAPVGEPVAAHELAVGLPGVRQRALGALIESNVSRLKTSIENSANEAAWSAYLHEWGGISTIPQDITNGVSPATHAFIVALLCRAVRPDLFVEAAEAFLRVFFDSDAKGRSVVELYKQPAFDSEALEVSEVLKETSCSTPMLLVASAGYDVSGRVEVAAKSAGRPLGVVAMGSREGLDAANALLGQAMRNGSWVLLKNVHLTIQFLSTLEKRLHAEHQSGRTHVDFRLILCSEPSPRVPASLIATSIVAVFEPPPGLRANLTRALAAVSAAAPPGGPKELPRLYFLTAWLHAWVVERLTYAPLGWGRRYEFAEADVHRSVGIVASVVARTAGERKNLPPNEMPWRAMRELIGETVYGGRINVAHDDLVMQSFCKALLKKEAFDASFEFAPAVGSHDALCCAGTTMDDFKAWVAALPDATLPEWIGLPPIATQLVLEQRASETLQRLSRISPTDDGASAEGGDVAPWAVRLGPSLAAWAAALRPHVGAPPPSAAPSPSPLVVVLRRELRALDALCAAMVRDMDDLRRVGGGGGMKPSNHHRSIVGDLLKNVVPPPWRPFPLPSPLTAEEWVAEVARRLAALAPFRGGKEGDDEVAEFAVPVGLLAAPGAFWTATRQHTARLRRVPLERVVLRMALHPADDVPPPDEGEIDVGGTALCGAAPTGDGRFGLSNGPPTPIAIARLRWEVEDSENAKVEGNSLPIFHSATREVVLGSVVLPSSDSQEMWQQRGVCLVLWSPAT